MVVLSYTIILS